MKTTTFALSLALIFVAIVAIGSAVSNAGSIEWQVEYHCVWTDEQGFEHSVLVGTEAVPVFPVDTFGKRLRLHRFNQFDCNNVGLPADPGATSPGDAYNHFYPGVRGDNLVDHDTRLVRVRCSYASDAANPWED